MLSPQEMEEKIMFEKEYDWRKHFLFDLPEILETFIKIGVIFALFHLAAYSITSAVIDKLPSFCEIYTESRN